MKKVALAKWRKTLILIGVLLPTYASASEVVNLPDCSFKLSVETNASKSTIWRLWTDVENWKKFDTLLEYSYLINDAEFAVGSQGYVKAKGTFKTRFEITELTEDKSFTERLKVPLYQSIDLKRYFEESENGKTIFTHEVSFKGPLRLLIYAVSADTFKKELPLVMGRLKALAEEERQNSMQIQ